MGGTVSQKSLKRSSSALDMAVANKSHASMSVKLSDAMTSGTRIEGVEEGVDQDFAMLSAQIAARDSWRQAEQLSPLSDKEKAKEKKVNYKGNEIRLLSIGMLYAEPVQLFDGAVAELTGAKEIAGETGNEEKQEIHGEGGMLVLALSDAENIVVVPLEDFTVSNANFSGTAKKSAPNDGSNTMPGFIQNKNIIFQSKSSSGKDRIVSSESLEINDEKLHMNDVREYNFLAGKWEEIPGGMDADSGGMSVKETIIEQKADRENDRQKKAKEAEDRAAEVRKAGTPKKGIFEKSKDAASAKLGKLLSGDDDEGFEISAGSSGLEIEDVSDESDERVKAGANPIKTLSDLAEQAVEDIKTAAEAVEAELKDSWERLSGAIEKLPEDVRAQYYEMRDAMMAQAEQIKSRLLSEIESFENIDIKEQLSRVMTGVQSLGGLMSDMSRGIEQGVLNSLKAVYAFPDNALEYISKTAQNMKTAILDTCAVIGSDINEINQITADTYNNLKDTFSESFSFLKEDWDVFKDTIKTTLNDIPGSAMAVLEDTAVDKIEEYTTKIDATIDAAKMYRKGASEDDIKKMLLDKYKMKEEEEEKEELVNESVDLPVFEFLLLPFLQFEVNAGFAVKLDDFFDKPSFGDLIKKHDFSVGAGIQGGMGLSMEAGVSAGIPVFAELFGGLKGALTLAGAGEEKKILAGTLKIPFDIKKTTRGDSEIVYKDTPTLDVKGALDFIGALSIGVDARSNIWGIDKSLYEKELGEWKLFQIQMLWNLVKENPEGPLLSGWKLKDQQTTLEAGGKTILDSARSSAYLSAPEDANVIVQAGERSRESYLALMDKLRDFKNKSRENLVAITPGSEAFLNMVDQAYDIEQEIMNVMQLDCAQIGFAVDFIDRFRRLDDYEKDMEEANKSIAKHKERISQINNAQNAKQREKIAESGYKKWFEDTAANRMFLFKDNSAYKFYKEKQKEETARKGKAGVFSLKKDMEELVREEYGKRKGMDPSFGASYDKAFIDFYMDAIKDKEAVVRAFADRDMIRWYETKRRAVKMSEAKDKLREKEIKPDYGKGDKAEKKRNKALEEKKDYLKGIAKEQYEKGNLGWMFTGEDPYNRIMRLEAMLRNASRMKVKDQIDEQNEKTAEILLGIKKPDSLINRGARLHPGALKALKPDAMRKVIERYYVIKFRKDSKDNITEAWLRLVRGQEDEENDNDSSKDNDSKENAAANNLQGGLSRIVSLEDILDYEQKRLSAYLAIYQKEGDASKKKEAWSRYLNHLHRVNILNYSIHMVSDPKLSAKERRELEIHLIEKYFQGYAVRNGANVNNEGFAHAVLKGEYTPRSIRVAIADDYKERLKNLHEEADAFSDRESYKGRTRQDNLISAMDYLRSLSDDENEDHLKALEQLVKEGKIKPEHLDMEQYRRAKSWDMRAKWADDSQRTEHGKDIENTDRTLALIGENPSQDEFVKKYREIWGDKYDGHMENVINYFPYNEIKGDEFMSWYRFDSGWIKHDDRFRELESAEEKDRAELLEEYIGQIGSAAFGKNFIEDAYEQLKMTLTPDRIYKFETQGRYEEDKAYNPILELLSPVMDENGLKGASKDLEMQKSIYGKLIKLDTEFFKDKKGDISGMISGMKKDKSAFAGELMLEYENDRKTHYEDVLAKVDGPRKSATETVGQLTQDYADMAGILKELEGILENPAGFLRNGKMGEDHPLEKVAAMPMGQWENPSSEDVYASKISELMGAVGDIARDTNDKVMIDMYSNRDSIIKEKLDELRKEPVLV